MKRPGVVWVYTILVVLNIIYTLFVDLPILVINKDIYTPVVSYYIAIFSLIILIPMMIFIYLFFMLNRKSLIWLYISFGLSLVASLIDKSWVTAVVIVIFGWVVWDYIVHKKIDGKPVFT